MKKREILAEVVGAVTDATEIDSDVILSRSRKEEDVEARMILIYACSRRGVRPVQLARLIGQTPHNVYRSLRALRDRYKYSVSFRHDCDFVCKQLGITCDLGGN